ncbi:MAG: ubiquitin-like small modifier protein 1 [Promethearchaeota archaeon]
MPKIKIVFFSILKDITKKKEDAIEIESTVASAVHKLIEKYGDDLRERLLDNDGQFRKHIVLYVNGKDVRYLNGFDTKLKDGDEIAFLPAAAGG